MSDKLIVKRNVLQSIIVSMAFFGLAAILLSFPLDSSFNSVRKSDRIEFAEKVLQSPQLAFPAGFRSAFEFNFSNRSDGQVNHRFACAVPRICIESFSFNFRTNVVAVKLWKPSLVSTVNLPVLLLRLLI